VELHLRSPNMPSLRGAQLRHSGNLFTFTVLSTMFLLQIVTFRLLDYNFMLFVCKYSDVEILYS
jgi:hypothetical protein